MRQPRPAVLLPLALVATAALAGCASDESGGSSGSESPLGALAATAFVSTQVTQAGDDWPLVPGTQIRLRFSDRTVTADAGCNQLGGDAAYSDGVLRIQGSLSMTEMGCPGPRMAQDEWLAGILGGGPTLTLDGDILTLTSGETVIELLDDDIANPDRPLVGTAWTLESIGDSSSADGAVSSVPAGVRSTLSIDAEGRVAVSPGCNTGGGQATIGDDVIEFGPIALTRMACPGAESDVEAAVLAVIDGEVDFTIDADMLTLTKGDSTLTYRAG